jgi:hypothetical protein
MSIIQSVKKVIRDNGRIRGQESPFELVARGLSAGRTRQVTEPHHKRFFSRETKTVLA